ncbi:MAG: site-specific DNA-methyltransferase [Alphaproteobacteria bacterium]|jgi:site-specific DNA-methyltransferase (adenine-specific)|nr:site-specific DNA-methyltransferase [Alphaproteobacteria bacterium]
MLVTTDKYTLYCGDALDILPEINGVDLCVTDPPYMLTSGGRTEGGLHERIGGEYDNSGNFFEGDCPEWRDFMPLIYACLREDAHAYVMADSKNQFEMQRSALEAGFRFHNLLYWDKGTCTPNRWYMKNAEYVGFFFKGKGFAINDCSSKQGLYVPQIDQTAHPTEKPALLMRHYITNSSKAGECVIDPFMGSGTTGVAAIRAGRRFIGIERDPRWFDVAQERIEQAANNSLHQTVDLFSK